MTRAAKLRGSIRQMEKSVEGFHKLDSVLPLAGFCLLVWFWHQWYLGVLVMACGGYLASREATSKMSGGSWRVPELSRLFAWPIIALLWVTVAGVMHVFMTVLLTTWPPH